MLQICFHGSKNTSFIIFKSFVKNKLSLCSNLQNCASKKSFHTTSRCFINPILLALIKPATRIASMLSGRFLGKWWKNLPEAKRLYYKNNIAKNPHYVGTPILLATMGGGIYYFTHLQTTPITNRKRFIGFSEENMKRLSEMELQKTLKEVEGKVVKGNLPVYKRIANVVQTIINNNQDIEQMKKQMWKIYLIDDDASNAFVTPTGEIFVYTGILRFISNDHQLAFIITHEMAHTLLNHAAEQVSRGGIIDVFLMLLLVSIWAVMPADTLAIFTQWLCDQLMAVLLHLPYSRKLETEADDVALRLISKACFDPREGSVFWQKRDLISQLQRFHSNNNAIPNEASHNEGVMEFLSTHPNFHNRAKNLDQQINESMELRKECGCADLGPFKQSADVVMLLKLLDQCLTKQNAT